MFHQEDEGLCQVLDVNPGEPLAAVANGSSDEFLEEGDHLTEGPSLLTEDDAEPGDDNPGAFIPGFQSLSFPFNGKPREKIIARRSFLGKFFIPVKTIVTHGRGAEERDLADPNERGSLPQDSGWWSSGCP